MDTVAQCCTTDGDDSGRMSILGGCGEVDVQPLATSPVGCGAINFSFFLPASCVFGARDTRFLGGKSDDRCSFPLTSWILPAY